MNRFLQILDKEVMQEARGEEESNSWVKYDSH